MSKPTVRVAILTKREQFLTVGAAALTLFVIEQVALAWLTAIAG